MSAWWDLRTDDGVPFDDIVEMWALARPDNWNATDTDTTAFPAERMSDAGQLVLGASPNDYDLNTSNHGTDE